MKPCSLAFVERFPGTDVYSGSLTPQQWLAGSTAGLPHREAALEELMLLWFENRNPTFTPFRELFDDTDLAEKTVYTDVTAALPTFFATMPELGQGRGGIFNLLLEVLTAGGALSDQLALLRGRWGFAIEDIMRRLLLAGDVLKEEEVALWLQFNPADAETLARRNRFGGWGDAHAEVPTYTTAMNEYEAFSQDQDWMPRTVMIAKSTYVWLNQLSRFYGREITTLNQIPDEELQTLASRGMNALWLIGVWERSRASQTIKRLCGNPDAVASAYSLYDYSIAHSLGGEPAYRDLRDRCSRYGIRLASDMVPNHMGIDSTWVIEHPEWFLSRHDSPYPAYTFNGPDLSGDDRVEIKIEDHYYNQSDAAVVFLRRDKWTGDTQFIYHGNDGTSFPWNDTAQLNYLSAQVREQVIQTILHVARPVPHHPLRRRHDPRQAPCPAPLVSGPRRRGSIPSRAESAMTTSDFDAALPEEFWREVVDRVAREVPGTLLLAEAFWMMEGYFVRTLGMHRVYNSAFMVMLRDEDNANYRTLLKNTLEFDPGIMKRYVNFMSNPDERTAIDQFGSGDKFFGVATLMATLPGLPMFGHGSVEGFTEKYGMEYYRPRFEEWPNHWLVERHNREIAPLLHRRSLFAESDNFLLYDFWHSGGGVNENVFAYSNQSPTTTASSERSSSTTMPTPKPTAPSITPAPTWTKARARCASARSPTASASRATTTPSTPTATTPPASTISVAAAPSTSTASTSRSAAMATLSSSIGANSAPTPPTPGIASATSSMAAASTTLTTLFSTLNSNTCTTRSAPPSNPTSSMSSKSRRTAPQKSSARILHSSPTAKSSKPGSNAPPPSSPWPAPNTSTESIPHRRRQLLPQTQVSMRVLSQAPHQQRAQLQMRVPQVSYLRPGCHRSLPRPQAQKTSPPKPATKPHLPRPVSVNASTPSSACTSLKPLPPDPGRSRHNTCYPAPAPASTPALPGRLRSLTPCSQHSANHSTSLTPPSQLCVSSTISPCAPGSPKPSPPTAFPATTPGAPQPASASR